MNNRSLTMRWTLHYIRQDFERGCKDNKIKYIYNPSESVCVQALLKTGQFKDKSTFSWPIFSWVFRFSCPYLRSSSFEKEILLCIGTHCNIVQVLIKKDMLMGPKSHGLFGNIQY